MLARLIRQLQHAYSGELAAAYAYRGHWRSVSDPGERERVHAIEDEEWHHRELIGGILRELGASPLPGRELLFLIIGRTLGAACHVSGHFFPMYGAGKLERKNIVEYEDAADYALACGRTDLIDCLLTMAEVEWEHEQYFRSRVTNHPLLRIFRLWGPPPPKETIRARFAEAIAKSA
ncbi:MAG: ferritin-like protein [Acidobacteria bacterium]|nr:ferritin-like protein [Acidobacteriota bacterium]